MRQPIRSAIFLIAISAALLCVLPSEAAAQSGRGCINDRYGNPQCPPPGGRCMADLNGNIRCSTPGGGIMPDRYQTPVCGPGQCQANRTGDITCSGVVRGSAAIDLHGEVVCTGGCVPAMADACVVPVK